MPVPRWLKACWQSTHFCGRCVFGLIRWISWIVLFVLAGLQVFILTKHELDVPQFILREVEDRLGEAGLHAKFGHFTFDPTGCLLVRDVSVSLLSSDTTVLRAKSIALQVDPIAIWFREIDPSEIRVSGVDLLIPAALSPSGQTEPIVAGIDARIRRHGSPRSLRLENLTARVGPVALSAYGDFLLPDRSSGPATPFAQILQSFSNNYLQKCRLISETLTRLPKMEGAKLELSLTPHPRFGAATAVRASVESFELQTTANPQIDLRVLDAIAFADLFPGGGNRIEQLSLQAGRIDWASRVTAEDLKANLTVEFEPESLKFSPQNLTLVADHIVVAGVKVEGVSAQSILAGIPVIQSTGIAQVGGGVWSFATDLDITVGAGRVVLAGEVGAETLDIAADKIGFDVPSILSWSERPVVQAELMLGPGGRPLSAKADLSTGPVTARWVPLDATSAHVTWQNDHLRADQILLRRGQSLAFGSYDMDTDDLDFRFLLDGQLMPNDINGWFRDWWVKLFAMFEFPTSPPRANVEVSGRWKQPLDTVVFISADADDAIVKGIAMERMRTRLFVRPGWVDVLNFISEREPGIVRGRFARQWRLPDSRRWTRLEIHAAGVSDLSPVPNLLRSNGDAIIEPFDFTNPVEMRLDGEITRSDWDQPAEENFVLVGKTTGSWRFKNFPLEDVEFSVTRRHEKIEVNDFTTGFAGGKLQGKVELTGATGEAKQLAFDVNLEDASLGRTIEDVSEWTASRRGETAADPTDFETQMAAGKLAIALSAVGPADDPFGLKGTGNIAVTHPDLANVNLLGVLSGLLKRTILNFSTLQLSHANADFTLDGPKVTFPDLKISGKRGALDASGIYDLETKALDFNTRVRPFEGGEGLLDAVFTPFSSALEVKLEGIISKPRWTFVFGPTNILRNLTGENNRSNSPSNPPKPPPHDVQPSTPIPEQDSISLDSENNN